MKRGSSTRLMGAPRTSGTSIAIAVLLSSPGSGVGWDGRRGPGPHHRRGLPDRGDDVVIARAAADVAVEGMADLVVRGIGRPGQEVGCGHDHPRRAEPALEAVLLP